MLLILLKHQKSIIPRSETKKYKSFKTEWYNYFSGTAGTGNFLAVVRVWAVLLEKKLKELYYQDLLLEVGERLGFLPEIWKESRPYLRPLYESLWFVSFWKDTEDDRDWWYWNSSFGSRRGRTLKIIPNIRWSTKCHRYTN